MPDAPPRETSGRRQRPTVDDKLRESLKGTYEMAGVLVMGIGLRPRKIGEEIHAPGDPGLVATGEAIVTRADAAVEAWLDLADKNPKVKTALRRFTEGSAFAGLIGVHVAMAAPVLASRGILPPQLAVILSTEPTAPSSNGNGESSA